jgi:hypothetical protein
MNSTVPTSKAVNSTKRTSGSALLPPAHTDRADQLASKATMRIGFSGRPLRTARAIDAGMNIASVAAGTKKRRMPIAKAVC